MTAAKLQELREMCDTVAHNWVSNPNPPPDRSKYQVGETLGRVIWDAVYPFVDEQPDEVCCRNLEVNQF